MSPSPPPWAARAAARRFRSAMAALTASLEAAAARASFDGEEAAAPTTLTAMACLTSVSLKPASLSSVGVYPPARTSTAW